MISVRSAPAFGVLTAFTCAALALACSLTSDVSELTRGSATASSGGAGGVTGGGATGGSDVVDGGGTGGTSDGSSSGGAGTGGSAGGTGGSAGAPPMGATFLFWVDSGSATIHRADADGGNMEPITTFDTSSEASFLRSIVVDDVGEKLYFTDDSRGKVLRANLDGSDVEDIVTGLDNPVGLDLDVASGKVYFADQGAAPTIYRADLNGDNVEPLITTGILHPYGLVLDLEHSKMYFVDNGIDAIFRADLDGSNLEDIGVAGLVAPIEIKLDPVEGKLYWTDIGDPDLDAPANLRRANLDGSQVEDVITPDNTPGFSTPIGLDVDEIARKLYFVDGGTGGLDVIQTSNLDGSNVRPLVVGLTDPRGIALAF